MKAVFVKLPDPLFHDLAQHAKTSALTRSEIIRSALTAYLLQDAQPFCASCADRAKRWTGIMQGLKIYLPTLSTLMVLGTKEPHYC